MKKNQRGMMGYVALVAAFILIAVALNGGLGQSVSRRIEYPELLTAIREDNVKAVAIRGTSLVGLYRNGTVSDADFPERGYDFETTIGSDFIDTVRQMTATAQGKSLDEVSVSDLPFTVEYRAPVVTPWYMEFLQMCIRDRYSTWSSRLSRSTCSAISVTFRRSAPYCPRPRPLSSPTCRASTSGWGACF